MRESIFTYNLSRPYPFRWFTPVVVVGGILITAGLVVLSVGTAGYQLVSVSEPDANITEARTNWFSPRVGALVGSMQPLCASVTIPINSILYTNNTALRYTLTDIFTKDGNGLATHQGSLAYHQNPLRNCTVIATHIEFSNIERPARNIGRQMGSASTRTFVDCHLDTPQGIVYVRLTAKYSFFPDDADLQGYNFGFAGRNSSTQASLYWGESLLAMHWIDLTNAFFVENQDPKFRFYKGAVSLYRSRPPPTTAVDVESLDFFDNVGCIFFPFSPNGKESRVAYCKHNQTSDIIHTIGNDQNPLPSLWIPADALSKSLYYTILADLGQFSTSHVNMLTDSRLLGTFSSNFTAIKESVNHDNQPWGQNQDPNPDLATTPFTSADSARYDLRINPSVFAATYLCQEPKLKPVGSLIISVLVATFVLLQTIWLVFKLVIDHVLMKKHPEMGYCEGCRNDTTEPDHLRSRNMNSSSALPILGVPQLSSIYKKLSNDEVGDLELERLKRQSPDGVSLHRKSSNGRSTDGRFSDVVSLGKRSVDDRSSDRSSINSRLLEEGVVISRISEAV